MAVSGAWASSLIFRALRADMRELLDQVRTLIQQARPTSPRQHFDDEW